MKKYLLTLVALCLLAPTAWSQQQKQQQAEEQKAAVLRASRSYNLTVAKLEPVTYVTLEKQWAFSDHVFPKDLLVALRKSKLLQEAEKERLIDVEKIRGLESRYVRWPKDDRGRATTGAMLRYVIGEKRAELLLQVDLTLDHTVGEGQPIHQVSFGPLHATVDLEQSLITKAQWDGVELPGGSHERRPVEVEDYLQVSITGIFDDETRDTLKSVARLMPDEGFRLLSGLWQYDFTNESHYGISLLWPDLKHVRHGLMIMESRRRDSVGFWYSMSGAAWPLTYVRRQLQDDGWPLVLRGHEYVGVTEEGVRVFRPMQFVLSKQSKAPK